MVEEVIIGTCYQDLDDIMANTYSQDLESHWLSTNPFVTKQIEEDKEKKKLSRRGEEKRSEENKTKGDRIQENEGEERETEVRRTEKENEGEESETEARRTEKENKGEERETRQGGLGRRTLEMARWEEQSKIVHQQREEKAKTATTSQEGHGLTRTGTRRMP
ncbi:hypothetical protein NDU88_004667 [Pleurodeles waltl]|uniref:Uncharacterized protein n=1 Tax=Pleurodeles waltl TaxID=8319 RepID=A0AAV7M7R1_PLEWA|nr:hypothetical protein NDU88_004667 [Pleurodeles waltl]